MARIFKMKWLSSLVLSVGLSGCAGSIDEAIAPQDAGPQPRPSPLVQWPTSKGDKPVAQTIRVTDKFDGALQRYYGVGELSLVGAGEKEDKPGALFELEDGGSLSNVVLGEA